MAKIEQKVKVKPLPFWSILKNGSNTKANSFEIVLRHF